MKKIYSLLIILIGIFMVNISDIKATCYEYCHDGTCEYSNTSFEDTKTCVEYRYSSGEVSYMLENGKVNISPGSSTHGVQMSIVDLSICLNDRGYTHKTVGDSNCSTSNSSNGSGTTVNTKVGYEKVSCGNLGRIPKKVPEISSWLITLLQVAVPVILIIMGVIDFVKSLSSQKDDEIKKNQQMFVKRVITAVIIFFVVVVVKLLVSLVSSGQTEKESIVKCIDCFISNKCS